jgi:hypothetical protein
MHIRVSSLNGKLIGQSIAPQILLPAETVPFAETPKPFLPAASSPFYCRELSAVRD